MTETSKADLVRRVILGARQHGISSVLFRNLIGERLGLNVTDMKCLGLLFHKGISSPSELARHTGLSSGATTATLDRLEKSGLIERQPNPDDRRGTLIVLVKTGAEKLSAGLPHHARPKMSWWRVLAKNSWRCCLIFLSVQPVCGMISAANWLGRRRMGCKWMSARRIMKKGLRRFDTVKGNGINF